MSGLRYAALLLFGCQPSTPPPPTPIPVSVVHASDFSTVFETVSPSVVSVVAGRQSQGRFRPERTGTGMVWDAHGHIITNDHLILEAPEVRVRTKLGQVLAAQIVATDGLTDLAVLKVKAALIPIARGRGETLRPGQWVAAIGNPYGMQHSITVGVVSALNRYNLPGAAPRYGTLIQTDLSINPGNSGGPLVGGDGRVVGMNVAIFQHGQGLSFATPIEQVTTVVERLIADGRFNRGFGGLYVKRVSGRAAQAAGLTTVDGARVKGVVQGGPAEKAGLKPGDIILSFGDRTLSAAGELSWLIATTNPGQVRTLRVARGEERLKLSIQISAAP